MELICKDIIENLQRLLLLFEKLQKGSLECVILMSRSVLCLCVFLSFFLSHTYNSCYSLGVLSFLFSFEF